MLILFHLKALIPSGFFNQLNFFDFILCILSLIDRQTPRINEQRVPELFLLFTYFLSEQPAKYDTSLLPFGYKSDICDRK